jgi:hypothetical protein
MHQYFTVRYSFNGWRAARLAAGGTLPVRREASAQG